MKKSRFIGIILMISLLGSLIFWVNSWALKNKDAESSKERAVIDELIVSRLDRQSWIYEQYSIYLLGMGEQDKYDMGDFINYMHGVRDLAAPDICLNAMAVAFEEDEEMRDFMFDILSSTATFDETKMSNASSEELAYLGECFGRLADLFNTNNGEDSFAYYMALVVYDTQMSETAREAYAAKKSQVAELLAEVKRFI